MSETNAAGTVTRVERYTPYGEPSDMQLDAGPGFTGHATDVATGLTYMQQRYYDPEIIRFPVPYPVGPEEDFIKHFNRYVYAYGNPVRYTDPDGRISRETVINENAAASAERSKTPTDLVIDKGIEIATGTWNDFVAVTQAVFDDKPVPVGPMLRLAVPVSPLGLEAGPMRATVPVTASAKLSSTAKGVVNLIPEGKFANHLFVGTNKLADNSANRTLIQKLANGKPIVIDRFGKSWYMGSDSAGKSIYAYAKDGIIKEAGYPKYTIAETIAKYGIQ